MGCTHPIPKPRILQITFPALRVHQLPQPFRHPGFLTNEPPTPTMKPLLASLAALPLTASLAFAAKDVDIKPAITTPGKPVFESHLKDATLDAPWTIAKGDWVVQDGAIVGKEKASDNHPAVLFLKLPARDSVIRFSYKLDGADKFELSYNQPKGHLFRVIVGTDSLAVAKDRDKKDAASNREALGKATAALSAGEWHTMLVEVKGEQVEVQTDDGAKVESKEASLAVDKTGYRFVIHGASLLIDDIHVWEVAP